MTYQDKAKQKAREKFKCWHPDCDNNQTITDAEQQQDGSWEPVPVQCRYCWTREEITAQTITDLLDELQEEMGEERVTGKDESVAYMMSDEGHNSLHRKLTKKFNQIRE